MDNPDEITERLKNKLEENELNSFGSKEICRIIELVARGSNSNVWIYDENSKREMPLLKFCILHRKELKSIIPCLLIYGVNVNYFDSQNSSPLFFATMANIDLERKVN